MQSLALPLLIGRVTIATMFEYRNEHTCLCKQPLSTFMFSEARMEEYDG
jgi:hypothetical protein